MTGVELSRLKKNKEKYEVLIMFKMEKTINLYEYAELSESAKEKAKNDYLAERDSCCFSENCDDRLDCLFPNSELSVEYSIGYCQGDGLNIYGTLRLDDVIEHVKNKFSEKELKTLKWMFNNYCTEYTMKRNDSYSYCICDRHEYMEDVEYDMGCDYIRDILYELIGKFNKVVQLYMEQLCKELETDGYEYFYEVSDEEMEDMSTANGWLYYESGELSEYSIDDVEYDVQHTNKDNIVYVFTDWFAANVDNYLLKA